LILCSNPFGVGGGSGGGCGAAANGGDGAGGGVGGSTGGVGGGVWSTSIGSGVRGVAGGPNSFATSGGSWSGKLRKSSYTTGSKAKLGSPVNNRFRFATGKLFQNFTLLFIHSGRL